MIDKTDVLKGMMLYDTFSQYRHLTTNTVDECFMHCFEDCFCMSFQICQNTECHLMSSNQFQNESKLITAKGCSYYDMLPDLDKIRQINASGCKSVSSCRIHSNLCKNGGYYVEITPTDYTTPRYKCQCPAGYTGRLCQNATKSCHAYRNGPRLPGIYQVFDDDMKPFEVFCTFDSDMSWTLIQSYQLKNKYKFRKAFFEDAPMNEDTPRWDEYRLSKSRMQSIQDDSNKFRMTCKYDTVGIVYDDFLVAAKKDIDIMTYRTGACTLVDYISIRTHDCALCKAYFYQDTSNPFHIDSSKTHTGCDFSATDANGCGTNGPGEDNFGLYDCTNPAHQCSSSENATTQTWLGLAWS